MLKYLGTGQQTKNELISKQLKIFFLFIKSINFDLLQELLMMYIKMTKACNNENCKGNPLIVMVTASPTVESNKCTMKHVVLLLCNGACLINNIKKGHSMYQSTDRETIFFIS
jgi:hypothetical protein